MKFKGLVLLLTIGFVFAGNAWAVDIISSHADAYSSAYSKSLGLGVGVAGAQSTNEGNSVVASGDETKVKAYSFSAPSLSANQGVGEANIYSIFGGVGISNTEEYQVAIEKISVINEMKNAGFFTDDEAKAEALEAFAQLKEATKDKRVLGFLWKTRGKHLLNGFGLLASDSFVDGKVKTAEE